MWYFVGRGRDSIISTFIKEHYTFPNVVISKGPDVNYAHGQLWGIMDRFICIVNNSQNRLVVVYLNSHGANVIFISKFDYGYA